MQQAAAVRHIQSPAERKQDIMAQAMQEQKIFEENSAKQEPQVPQVRLRCKEGLGRVQKKKENFPFHAIAFYI